MSISNEDDKKRLRSYLNKTLQGENVDNILETLSTASSHLINNVKAVNDMIYVATAVEEYLDQRLADYNLVRPQNVGLEDDIFRKLGIEVANRKQVRDLISNILEIMYGEEFTRSTLSTTNLEPFSLEDGDTLIIEYDGGEQVEIPFSTSQFSNISSASAQEVADAITRNISRLGRSGYAIAQDDGLGGYVTLISDTIGPSSTIRVLGGKSQNALKFPDIRPTGGNSSTQWTLSLVAGGKIRATWTGGSNPFIGKVKKNDYVNIYGSSFSTVNQGTYTISKVQGGLVGNAYVEYENANGIAETVVQGADDAILFYNPQKAILSSKFTFAAAYQTESRLLEIFIPATTKVVRRERKGAAYLAETDGIIDDNYGPYVYDTDKQYIIGSEECFTTSRIDSTTELLINVDDASEFPDEEGYLVLGYGTSKEEGPVPYISRPSSGSILINPSYRIQEVHEAGTDVSLISQNYSYTPEIDGSDYPFYLTDVVSGRVYTEELIQTVKATGINILITVLYPNDIGLGKWGTENSEKYWVWGEDDDL